MFVLIQMMFVKDKTIKIIILFVNIYPTHGLFDSWSHRIFEAKFKDMDQCHQPVQNDLFFIKCLQMYRNTLLPDLNIYG